jgi:flagellar hook-basal body complex protein FliE
MDKLAITQPIGPHLNPSAKAVSQRKEAGLSFADLLKSSLTKVNEMQQQAETATAQLVSGESKDIHNTMITVQKAEISFELLMQIRNKLISAYDEIRRMPL